MAAQPHKLEVVYMMAVMKEFWDRLDALLLGKMYIAIKAQLQHDVDKLLLLAMKELFFFQREKLQVAGALLREELNYPTEFASKAAAEKCAHRFLSRSYQCLQNLIEFCLRHFKEPEEGDDYLQLIRGQMKQIEGMTQRLVFAELDLSLDEGITCRRPNCGSADHFHSTDRLTWLSHQKDLEQDIPLPSRPVITFRDFKLVTLMHTPNIDDCFGSLLDAVETSMLYHKDVTLPFKLQWTDPISILDYEEMVSVEHLAEALSTVSSALLQDFEVTNYQLQIGIILPGGSQVFWPYKALNGHATNIVSVYIMAKYCVENGETKLRFLPVKTQKRPKTSELTQTVKFENLPPEIRNMIYGLVLKDHADASLRSRQPPLSLTCRLIHKEIMSLLFKKHGWFVMI